MKQAHVAALPVGANQSNTLLVRVTATVTGGPPAGHDSHHFHQCACQFRIDFHPVTHCPREDFHRVQNIHQRLAQRFTQFAEGVLCSGLNQATAAQRVNPC